MIKSLKVLLTGVVSLALVFASALVYGVVTVQDPVSIGEPLSSTTVSIVFPDGEEKEAESDDDGILYWPGSSEPIVSLPEGAVVQLADGTALTYTTSIPATGGFWSTTHTLIAVGTALIISEATDGGGGGSSTTPPPDDTGTGDDGSGDDGTGDDGTGDDGTGDDGTGDDGTGDDGTGDPGTGDDGTGDPGTGDGGTGDPGTGDGGTGDGGTGDGTGDPVDPGELACPSEISITRTVNDTPCPLPMDEIQLINLGAGELTWTLDSVTGNFAADGSQSPSGTIAGGGFENVAVNYLCPSPDAPGTEMGTVTFSATDGNGDIPGCEVMLTATTEDLPPGELTNIGSLSFDLVHQVGTSSCPDSFGAIQIQNTGEKSIIVMVEFSASWLQLDGSNSATLAPGETRNFPFQFPCSGYSLGTQSTTVTVTSQDADDAGIDTGSETYQFQLTVNS